MEKRKMQNVSFRNIDEFIDFLPDNERKIVEYLRKLVLENIPDCTEKLSYNVPFFKRNSNICFIWPSSISWGNMKSQNTVRLGFAKGYLLNDSIHYLDKGDRKQVYWKDFSSIQEIDTDILKMFLFEAVHYDNVS